LKRASNTQKAPIFQAPDTTFEAPDKRQKSNPKTHNILVLKSAKKTTGRGDMPNLQIPKPSLNNHTDSYNGDTINMLN
jgi:hypothetical protein